MKALVAIALSMALSLAATLIAVLNSRMITRVAFQSELPDAGGEAQLPAAI